jgi:hypothetical protein
MSRRALLPAEPLAGILPRVLVLGYAMHAGACSRITA